MKLTLAEESEYLELLEDEYKSRAKNNLNDYCRYIEITTTNQGNKHKCMKSIHI